MDNGEITMQDASYYSGMSLKHLPKLRKGIYPKFNEIKTINS